MEAACQSQSRGGRGVGVRAAAVLSVALALGAGLGLRLWMLKQFFEVRGDPLVYGDLAKNLLLHGRYVFTLPDGSLAPTLARLPGYPLFLALCFRLFGMENYVAVCWAQIALELAGCLLLADFARRIAPPSLKTGSAHCTLWLAALCPFTAVYAAEPLTEALTLFVLALALWSAACFRERAGWGPALGFTFAVAYAALLRPDGALAAVALAPALLMGLGREERPSGAKGAAEKGLPLGRKPEKPPSGAEALDDSIGFTRGLKPPSPSEPRISAGAKARRLLSVIGGPTKVVPLLQSLLTKRFSAAWKTRDGFAAFTAPFDKLRAGLKSWHFKTTASGKAPGLARMALVCLLLALAPFAAWTARNWQVFHVFEPLAPRYANDPGQTTYPGWQRWVKTWCLDFVSTYEVYWPVPGSPLDLSKLPSRAFDSPAQYAETAALAADYNGRDGAMDIVPDVDARFAKLAEERIASHPLRYYVCLPLGRVADMWFRPRVENLNIDLDWWVYAHHHVETRFSWFYAGLNAFYLLLAAAGLCLRPRFWRTMVAYMLLRSALLTTIEAPETRYTLECFPMVFALGGVALWAAFGKSVELWKRVARLRLPG